MHMGVGIIIMKRRPRAGWIMIGVHDLSPTPSPKPSYKSVHRGTDHKGDAPQRVALRRRVQRRAGLQSRSAMPTVDVQRQHRQVHKRRFRCVF